MKQIISPTPQMPAPLLTFDGMNSAQSGCMCLPPDTDGDVGPNHYVQSVNSSIKIFDKNGNPLNGPNGTTYNSLFLLWQAHLVRASTMATGLSSTITSLIAGWPAISHSLERFPALDHSINALPFPKRATLSAAAGSFTRSSMIRPTRRGSAITQSSRLE